MRSLCRCRIVAIAAPSRVAIYNDDPIRSLKIAYFKWSGTGGRGGRRSLTPTILRFGSQFWQPCLQVIQINLLRPTTFLWTLRHHAFQMLTRKPSP